MTDPTTDRTPIPQWTAFAQDRLTNALDAMGFPSPAAFATLTVEVLPAILEDYMTLTGAHLTMIRGEAYGPPDENFARIWSLWQPILESPNLTGEQKVALAMIQVKVARLCQTPDHEDSIQDLSGYAATLDLLAGREPSV